MLVTKLEKGQCHHHDRNQQACDNNFQTEVHLPSNRGTNHNLPG